ncbi:MAG: type II toxin-antitoxin system VapC family toxin [Gemmatimonadetes bacterium]|nr:type II toxin-antitoxin system VapC family toxin [Gemmatimonadota bacterium]
MASALYLDTSAVLRAVLESGVSPQVEQKLRAARALVTSRLSLVESTRVLLRLRADGRASEENLADAAREIDAVWNRCEIWELTRQVCETASQVAPRGSLRTLDALHLATYVLARRHIDGLELLSADTRLSEAARSV